MKLTTKLLKEMIQQELNEMGSGQVHIAVYADGREEEISPEEAQELIASGAPQQDDFQTGVKRIFVDEPRDDMEDFSKQLDKDLEGMSPEEKKYVGF